MKVILTQEVKGKGGEGDVIDVAAGYAVNYLFPRKMAIEATAGNLKQLELRQHNIRSREEARLSDAAGAATALEGRTIVIEAKVGDEGRLFGSITAQMIEDAIAEQLDVNVDRRKMDVHGHIKQVGMHPVSVHVYRDVKATVMVNVVAEGAGAEATAAPAPVVEDSPVEEPVAAVLEGDEELESVDENVDVDTDAPSVEATAEVEDEDTES